MWVTLRFVELNAYEMLSDIRKFRMCGKERESKIWMAVLLLMDFYSTVKGYHGSFLWFSELSNDWIFLYTLHFFCPLH